MSIIDVARYYNQFGLMLIVLIQLIFNYLWQSLNKWYYSMSLILGINRSDMNTYSVMKNSPYCAGSSNFQIALSSHFTTWNSQKLNDIYLNQHHTTLEISGQNTRSYGKILNKICCMMNSDNSIKYLVVNIPGDSTHGVYTNIINILIRSIPSELKNKIILNSSNQPRNLTNKFILLNIGLFECISFDVAPGTIFIPIESFDIDKNHGVSKSNRQLHKDDLAYGLGLQPMILANIMFDYKELGYRQILDWFVGTHNK